jgi:tetratricopeptide (TPR) repeat protein
MGTTASDDAMESMTLRIQMCVSFLAVFCACAALGQESADQLAASRALLASGQLAKSEASLRTYLSNHPASADAHFLLGYVLFSEQRAQDSLAEFTAGAKVRRPKPDELKTVASDYVLLHDYSDADKWFTAVTVENPADADAWYLLGRTKYNEERYDEAVPNFTRALLLHPRYIEAENNLGLSWRELNKLDQAKAAFQAAIDWQSSSPVDAQPYLNLGTLLTEQGDLEKAIPNLVQAVALSPNNPKTHEQLASAYGAQNNLAQAQSELERAVAIAPDISSLHYKLAEIYRKQGLKDLARHEFEICEKLGSTHSSNITPNPLQLKKPAPH